MEKGGTEMTARSIVRKEPVAALFLGGLVGAGVALMLAPSSGERFRLKIGEFAGGVSDRAQDYVSQGKGKVVSLTGKGKEYFQGRRSMIAAGISAAREAYAKERERLAKRH